MWRISERQCLKENNDERVNKEQVHGANEHRTTVMTVGWQGALTHTDRATMYEQKVNLSLVVIFASSVATGRGDIQGRVHGGRDWADGDVQLLQLSAALL